MTRDEGNAVDGRFPTASGATLETKRQVGFQPPSLVAQTDCGEPRHIGTPFLLLHSLRAIKGGPIGVKTLTEKGLFGLYHESAIFHPFPKSHNHL